MVASRRRLLNGAPALHINDLCTAAISSEWHQIACVAIQEMSKQLEIFKNHTFNRLEFSIIFDQRKKKMRRSTFAFVDNL